MTSQLSFKYNSMVHLNKSISDSYKYLIQYNQKKVTKITIKFSVDNANTHTNTHTLATHLS